MKETMTFSEWYKFNCSGEYPIIDNYNKALVKIFKCLSAKEGDVIFTGKATLKDINVLFGNYNIFSFRSATSEDSNASFKIFLYLPQSNNS